MITRNNYSEQIKKVDLSKLHNEVIEAKELFDEVTQNGKDWSLVDGDNAIQEMVDLYFKSLEGYLPKKTATKTATKKAAPRKKKTVSAPKPKPSAPKKSVRPRKAIPRSRVDLSAADKVELVDLELKFIRRYVNMDGKVKEQNQIRLFLNALQKAIIEKRIRKTSKFAKEIEAIQLDLIKLFEALKINQSMTVKINPKRIADYYKVLGKQVEMQSVKFIKSYVNLQGKFIENKRAVSLHDRIVRAFNANRISKRDKYWTEVDEILKNLKSFVKKNKNGGVLTASKKELNGLNGILSECNCENLDGIDNPVIPRNAIISTTDIVNLKFDTLGFRGKWLNLIGDPTAGFTTMIFGKPKMGKSYLAVDLAQYLARNHGTVLYVANEEQITGVFQNKIIQTNSAHPDFYVTGALPTDLSPYDFVFIDSVNNYGLSADDLRDLKRKNPRISFVYIFQTTKHGAFRGSNEFQHDVDVVIEVPEKGKAIQFGRFNQGGEIEIFDNLRND